MPGSGSTKTPGARCAAERGVSHPKVSHKVEKNVVTRVERPPVPSRESAPAAPPRAAADDRQNSSRMRCPHLGPPHLPDDQRRGQPLLATHGSIKAAGRPLILQGSYPAGAPGGAWSKVQVRGGTRGGHGRGDGV